VLSRLMTFQDKHAVHPESGGRSRRLTPMVGLNCSCGDQRVCLVRLSIRNQIPELADLVASERVAGQIIALDPQVGAAKFRSKPLKLMDGSGEVGEMDFQGSQLSSPRERRAFGQMPSSQKAQLA